jgi:hypothetical protein
MQPEKTLVIPAAAARNFRRFMSGNVIFEFEIFIGLAVVK